MGTEPELCLEASARHTMRIFLGFSSIMCKSVYMVFIDIFLFITLSFTVPDDSEALPLDANVAREDDPVWRLPAIIAGSVGGFVIVITLIVVCAYRRVNSARTPIINRTKQSVTTETSPNHVVIQVK